MRWFALGCVVLALGCSSTDPTTDGGTSPSDAAAGSDAAPAADASTRVDASVPCPKVGEECGAALCCAGLSCVFTSGQDGGGNRSVCR